MTPHADRSPPGWRASILIALLAIVGLASCAEGTEEWPAPSPALWEVSAPGGEKGWLFGTIHALPEGAAWRTAQFQSTLDRSEMLVVEVANLSDSSAGVRAFQAVATSPGLPPLLRRVPPGQRAALAAALDRADLAEADFSTTESWAAALLLTSAGSAENRANGVDRALLAEDLPAVALESFAEQFAIFDRLAEADQAVLLHEAARESTAGAQRTLVRAWLVGDLQVIEREAREGLLADPELRTALLTGRNHAWVGQIADLIVQGRRPFVAVGAAHMLGPEGLPALLTARGYAVRRIQ